MVLICMHLCCISDLVWKNLAGLKLGHAGVHGCEIRNKYKLIIHVSQGVGLMKTIFVCFNISSFLNPSVKENSQKTAQNALFTVKE